MQQNSISQIFNHPRLFSTLCAKCTTTNLQFEIAIEYCKSFTICKQANKTYLSFNFQQSGHFLIIDVAQGLLSHKQYLPPILNLIFLLRSAVKPPAEPPLYRLCTIKISVEPEYTSWRCRRCRQEKLSTVFHSLIFPP